MGVLQDPALERLLDGLHARSDAQVPEMSSFWADRRADAQAETEESQAALKQFRADKLVAIDRDKAELCYTLCRAAGARRIVEIGTSYGASTHRRRR